MSIPEHAITAGAIAGNVTDEKAREIIEAGFAAMETQPPQTHVRRALERLLDACIREFGWHPAALAEEPVGDDPDCEIKWGDLQEAHRALTSGEASDA